jgi:tRNA A37 threonylcarbamoyladenosine synthetase subunit TsaC/SUA5/YrdC
VPTGQKAGINRIRSIRHLDDRHHFALVCQDFAQLSQIVHINHGVPRDQSIPGSYTFILPVTKEVRRRLMPGVAYSNWAGSTCAVTMDLGFIA